MKHRSELKSSRYKTNGRRKSHLSRVTKIAAATLISLRPLVIGDYREKLRDLVLT